MIYFLTLKYLGHIERSDPKSLVRRTLHGHMTAKEGGAPWSRRHYKVAAARAVQAFQLQNQVEAEGTGQSWVQACGDTSKEGKSKWAYLIRKGAETHDNIWRAHRRNSDEVEIPTVEALSPPALVPPPPDRELQLTLLENPTTLTTATRPPVPLPPLPYRISAAPGNPHADAPSGPTNIVQTTTQGNALPAVRKRGIHYEDRQTNTPSGNPRKKVRRTDKRANRGDAE